MSFKQIIHTVQAAIEKGEHVAPFLFLSPNSSTSAIESSRCIAELQNIYSLPNAYVLKIEDNDEAIKVSQIRPLLEKSMMKADYKIQIFVIENISRMTLGTSNALLKFFEEPGVGNIIFLTNASQSGVLDTILSRVQCVHLDQEKKKGFTQYIETLIENYVERNDSEILGYYFTKQIEKQDAFDFLYACIAYIKKTGTGSHLLAELQVDLQGLSSNNFLPKYVIDKYILLLKEVL